MGNESDWRTLRLPSGRRLSFCRLTGEVLGDKKWAETHVSSSGGGGYVSGHGGVVMAPTVTSQTVTRSEIWVRDDAGGEHAIELADFGVPVRPGQRLTAVWGILDDEKTGPYYLVENHTSGQHVINQKEIIKLANKSGPLGCLIIVAGLIGLILTFAANPLFGIVPLLVGVWLAKGIEKAKADTEAIRSHIERIRASLRHSGASSSP